jgi:hypothetical protein
MPPRERANASGAQMSDLALIGRLVQKKFEGAPARTPPGVAHNAQRKQPF